MGNEQPVDLKQDTTKLYDSLKTLGAHVNKGMASLEKKIDTLLSNVADALDTQSGLLEQQTQLHHRRLLRFEKKFA